MTIETQYFPPISFFALGFHFGHLILEGHENYQKRSFRNRTRIWSRQTPLSLTIPLIKGKNQGCPIQEVGIFDGVDWPFQHWKSVQTVYGKSPFFHHYADEIKSILFSESTTLFSYNNLIINSLVDLLHLPIEVFVTSSYQKEVEQDYRGAMLPNQEDKFEYPVYQQFDAENFQSNLSILDLIFQKGPESILYLEEVAQIMVQ